MGTKGTCKAEACEKDVVGKGYCRRHYDAWKRGGLPKARYATCKTAGCRKRQVKAGPLRGAPEGQGRSSSSREWSRSPSRRKRDPRSRRGLSRSASDGGVSAPRRRTGGADSGMVSLGRI
jgi:hypothetical protein